MMWDVGCLLATSNPSHFSPKNHGVAGLACDRRHACHLSLEVVTLIATRHGAKVHYFTHHNTHHFPQKKLRNSVVIFQKNTKRKQTSLPIQHRSTKSLHLGRSDPLDLQFCLRCSNWPTVCPTEWLHWIQAAVDQLHTAHIHVGSGHLGTLWQRVEQRGSKWEYTRSLDWYFGLFWWWNENFDSCPVHHL